MKPTKFIVILLVLGLFSAGIAYCQERITIATYYPSPEGVYKNMTLYPHDDFDPTAACAQDGAMYYDDSQNRGYVCEDGTWSPLSGGFRYLGRTDPVSSSSPAGPITDQDEVYPPSGTRYMFIARVRSSGYCGSSAGVEVLNQGTTSVYGRTVAKGVMAEGCSYTAQFDCFE